MRQWTGRMLALTAVIAWFLFLTHRALHFGFNPDDEMNLNFAMARPLKLNLESIPLFWNGYIRPLGSLFYLVLYRMFGYWAEPFRLATFAVLICNLVLLFCFAGSVTKSKLAAFLVTLAGCFHAEMWDIYASTGTIYDVICQSFVLLAGLVWVRSDARVSWRVAAAISALTIGAVEAKEMGVAIPAVLLIYDLLFRPKSIRYVAIGASGLVVILFLLGRFAQTTSVTGNAAYTPIVTVHQYLMTTQWYLDLLLFRPGLSEKAALLVLLGACVIAAALRNRIMLFGIAFYLLTLLPMSFAPLRAGYALYVPAIGALIFGGGMLARVDARRWIQPTLSFLIAICILYGQFSAQGRLQAAQTQPSCLPELESFTNAMRHTYPKLTPGTQVTIINDPFPDREIPLFTLRALYDDPSLELTRVRWDPARGPEQLQGVQTTLFFFGLRAWRFGAKDESGQVVDGRPAAIAVMSSPLAALNIVSGIAPEAMADGSRWAFADPELVFRRPASAVEFSLDYDVPGAILDRTGPLRLSFIIDDEVPKRTVVAAPGRQRYTAKVPNGNSSLVRVKIHAENPFQGNDGVKLSFLTTWAGLREIQ